MFFTLFCRAKTLLQPFVFRGRAKQHEPALSGFPRADLIAAL